MRTKTLLLSAAALLAGLISSQAQNVYSANVVGYYNVTVPAHGFFFLANQLTNAGNNVNSILTNGVVSDANNVTNTTLYRWNGTGYNLAKFFKGADADNYFLNSGSIDGWYDPVGNLVNYTLNQGSGNFLFNPANNALTVTLVGQVPQGTNNIPVTLGFNTYSIVPPISTNFDSALLNFPGTSDPNGVNNDVYYYFNGVGYNLLKYFTGADADNYFLNSGSVNGWYDPTGNYQSTNPNFQPKVGSAFFIRHFTGTSNWVQVFNVQ